MATSRTDPTRMLAPVILTLLVVATLVAVRHDSGSDGVAAAAAVVTTRSTPAEVGAMVGSLDDIVPVGTGEPTPAAVAPPGSGTSPVVVAPIIGTPIGPGTCFNGPTTTTAVTPVPCDGPHGNEVYVALSSPARPTDVYPGQEVLIQRIEEVCGGDAFNAYVGLPWGESRLATAPMVPSPETWLGGDRTLGCFLYDLQGPRQETARDSAT